MNLCQLTLNIHLADPSSLGTHAYDLKKGRMVFVKKIQSLLTDNHGRLQRKKVWERPVESSR